jgi:hypothetical protein
MWTIDQFLFEDFQQSEPVFDFGVHIIFSSASLSDGSCPSQSFGNSITIVPSSGNIFQRLAAPFLPRTT